MKKTIITIVVSGFVALVVALIVGLGLATHQSPTSVGNDQTLGAISGEVHNTPENFTQGLGMGGKYVNFSRSLSIAAGSNKGVWQNKTGRTVYVDRFDASLVPATGSTTVTATSTYAIYAYASSTPITTLINGTSTLYDFTAPLQLPGNGTSINVNNFSFATSSSATTTSSLDKAFAGKVIAIPDTAYFNILLQSPGPACTNTGAGAGSCYTATSTGRGFNIDTKLDMYYAP